MSSAKDAVEQESAVDRLASLVRAMLDCFATTDTAVTIYRLPYYHLPDLLLLEIVETPGAVEKERGGA